MNDETEVERILASQKPCLTPNDDLLQEGRSRLLAALARRRAAPHRITENMLTVLLGRRAAAHSAGRAPLVACLIAATSFHLILALAASWMAEASWVTAFSRSLEDFFLVDLGVVGFWLSCSAWRHFTTGEPLRRAWRMFTIAAAANLLGLMFSRVPAIYWPHELRPYGWVLAGPLRFVLLAGAFQAVRKTYEQMGMTARPMTRPEGVLITIGSVFATLQTGQTAVALWLTRPLSAGALLEMATGPLLVLLLVDCIGLRRTAPMVTPLARCWGAFAAAIFLTLAGGMGLGLTEILCGAAYALGPAWQVEATEAPAEKLISAGPSLTIAAQ